jgi:mRNA interferase MazF
MLVQLDPTRGREIRKTRPCVVVSPNEMNGALRTVVIAPMTTKGQDYPWRVPITFQGKSGRIAVDQMRTVDGERLLRQLGTLNAETAQSLLGILAEIFAP